MSFQSAPKRGNLWLALTISVLLHILLLWPTPSRLRSGDAAQPLVATLRTAFAAAPLPPKPVVVTPMREVRESRVQPSDLQRTSAAIAATPAQDTPAGLTAEAPLRSEVFTANAKGLSGAAAPQTPAGTVTAAGDGLDADGVRQYRLALAIQARRFKRYPAGALNANIGGTVEIRVTVAVGGLSQEVQLARSSGNDLLDDAALDMIRKAAPRTTVPEPLRSRAFVVSLPVVFDLASE